MVIMMTSHNNDDDDSNSERVPPSISSNATTTSNPGGEAKGVGRKRTIDESQLDPDELRKLESRRAYNRQCAAKARKRSKELVEHLQGQVEELTKEKAEAKRANELMRAQLELLEQQNHTLMMNQLANQGMAAGQGIGGHFGGGGGGQFDGTVGGAAAAAAFFGGQGSTANGGMSLLDRLTVERAAAQNRFQQLQLKQQQQNLSKIMGSNSYNNKAGDRSNGSNGGGYLG